MRVNCNNIPLVKNYFDARVEPQFFILLNGGELRRMIGFNFNRLHGFLEKASEFHLCDFLYFGNDQVKNTWEHFCDNYDMFPSTGDYDRNATRMFYKT